MWRRGVRLWCVCPFPSAASALCVSVPLRCPLPPLRSSQHAPRQLRVGVGAWSRRPIRKCGGECGPDSSAAARAACRPQKRTRRSEDEGGGTRRGEERTETRRTHRATNTTARRTRRRGQHASGEQSNCSPTNLEDYSDHNQDIDGSSTRVREGARETCLQGYSVLHEQNFRTPALRFLVICSACSPRCRHSHFTHAFYSVPLVRHAF